MTPQNGTYVVLETEHAALRQRVAELERSEQRLRAVFEGITDVILVMDQDGRYLDILPTNPDLLYKPSQELIGKTLHEVMPTAVADQFLLIVRQVLLTGVLDTIEYMLPIQGNEIWFNATLKPVSDTTIVLVARDITARKRAEEALRRDQAFFRAGPLVFFNWNSAEGWPVETVSPNVWHMFGYHADDFITGRVPYFSIVFPNDRERIIAEVQAHSAAGVSTFQQEYRILHSRGEIRWIYDFTTVIRNAQGTITNYYGYLLDITQHKQAEERLRANEAWLQTIIESNPIGVVITSAADGTVLYANEQLGQTFAIPIDQLIGQQAPNFYARTADREQFIQNVVCGDGLHSQEVEMKKLDGTCFWAVLSSRKLEFAGQEVIYSSVYDITERKQAERERLALHEQIIAAQQSAIRELSTPLIPIADGVVIMPLIGSIDSARAQQILETLLEGISRYRSRVAILDVTGVQVMDTQIASALSRAAKAVQLLGAQVILTGIHPQVAQTLVHLGVELDGIITRSTLQAGIAYVLQR